MSDFRVRTTDAAVQVTVNDDASPNARADRYIDQAGAVLACAPSRLRQCRSIAVVL